jgi:hypothetical protein
MILLPRGGALGSEIVCEILVGGDSAAATIAFAFASDEFVAFEFGALEPSLELELEQAAAPASSAVTIAS